MFKVNRTLYSLISVLNKVSVECIYDTYVFSGLNDAKGEIEALKRSLEKEKIQKTQGRLL